MNSPHSKMSPTLRPSLQTVLEAAVQLRPTSSHVCYNIPPLASVHAASVVGQYIDYNPTIHEKSIMKTRLPFAVATIVVSGVLMVQSAVHAADAPKVSTFAPAEDLANQVGQYIKAMKSTVADEQEYKDSEDKVVRDASTLAVIALALGLHDQDSKYKANAAALLKAAQDVAATKDYESAKKAVAALEAVAAAKGGLRRRSQMGEGGSAARTHEAGADGPQQAQVEHQSR